MLKQKGRWKKLFGRQPDYWYVAEKEKTADRPHAISLALSLLSPLLAIVATAISIQSLRTSEQSMKVGQRAYLSVKSTSIQTSINQKTELVEVTGDFELSNFGNTPAKVMNLDVRLSRNLRENFPESFPAGVFRMAVKHQYLFAYEIPAKSERKSPRFTRFFSFRKALRPVSPQRNDHFTINFDLTFQDVFFEPHTISWYYVYDSYLHNGNKLNWIPKLP